MQKIFKVAIIGGGASGLITAVELSQGKNKINGDDIVILEKNDRALKKLIATGNGQANLSNANLSKSNYYGDKTFIDEYFKSKDNFDVEEYFLGLGLPFTTLLDGRKYPLSKQANAVVDILRFTVQERKVNLITDFCVNDVVYKNGLFEIIGNKKVYAEKVVLAVGGKASPSFGTDGKSYALAQKFGHAITDLYPSLVQVKTQTDKIKALKGIKETAIVSAFDGNTFLKSDKGDLLFTEYGVSGSSVFQISGHLAKAKNPVIKIEFLPDYSKQQLIDILENRKNSLTCISTEDFLLGILHKKLGQVIMKSIPDKNVKTIADTLKNFTLKVTGTLGFNYAQVTKGGVETSCINPKTFESAFKKGLYLVGEMVDVDGDCGGYNLDFAFTSAYLSAIDIKSKI